MTQQYLRKVSVAVGVAGGAGLDFSAFRCVFTVRRGDYQNPNTCDVRVYNLRDDTANAMAKNPNSEFTYLALKAGYPGNYGLIFKGVIKQVRRGRVDQKDSYVEITAADGDEAYNFAAVSTSLKAGAKPDDVLGVLLDAVKPFGITAGYSPKLESNGCVRGRVFYGMARDELRDFAWDNDCAWSFQDNALTMIPFTSYVPGSVPVISPTTGLLGTPEQTTRGIEIRTLLNPNFKVGQLVKLDSSVVNRFRFDPSQGSLGSNLALQPLIKTNADGLYYVMIANHRGDTRGAAWWSDLICLAADASIITIEQTNALTAQQPSLDRF